MTLKGPLLALRRSKAPQRYQPGDIEVGTFEFHTAHADNLVVKDEELESMRDMMGFATDGALFDCCDWLETGKETYFARFGTSVRDDKKRGTTMADADGLLLARSDRLNGHGAGHTRMTRLQLRFNKPCLHDYLEKYEQQYTIS